MQNLSNSNSHMIMQNINNMLEYVYKRKPSKSRHLNFDKINIIYPKSKVYILDIKYLKNIKKLLNYYFANIEKKPFTSRNYNVYAFEALWILLSILDKSYGHKYRQKELFKDVTLIENIGNTMKFGKYVFTIPKYKQYTFDVKGFNMAKLTIV